MDNNGPDLTQQGATGRPWFVRLMDWLLSGLYDVIPGMEPSVGGEIPESDFARILRDLINLLFNRVVVILILIAVIIFGWKWR